MKISRVSRKYAAAYFDAIRKDENPREALAEIQSVSEIIDKEPDLQKLLTHPQLSPQTRSEVVQKSFQGRVSDRLYRFLEMLAKHNRYVALPAICIILETLVLTAVGVQHAVVTTAVPLDKQQTKAVLKRLKELTQKQIELETLVDTHLLGGMTIQVGDHFIDGSVRFHLERIRTEMKSARVG